jgi:hypothetical protein
VLYGRDAELSQVDGLLARARAGRSGVLVVRGDAGIGKSALLEYAATQAHLISGCRVLRSVAVESEMELPYAGLHLLLRSIVDRVDALPEPQAAAIRGAFGVSGASARAGGAVAGTPRRHHAGQPVPPTVIVLCGRAALMRTACR